MFAYRSIDSQATDAGEDANDVEKNYSLIGITGVEDVLQENVKACITDFMRADIKVWMLTGDKGATAQSIAKSCGIVDDSMEITELSID